MKTGSLVTNSIVQTANAYIVLGTESTAPVSPVDGTLYYNSNTASFQGHLNGQWVPLVSGIKPVFGKITAQSNTTTLAMSNSTPTITSGSQILSVSYTPLFTTSIIDFSLNFTCDCSASAGFTCMVFRGSTLLGVQLASLDQLTAALTNTSNLPTHISMRVMDQPASNSAVTYTVRFASTTGTWYVNQTSGFTVGGYPAFNGNYVIKEYF